MSHDTYDRMADWLEARRWTSPVTIYGGTFGAIYGLMFGFLVATPFLLLLALVPLAAVVMHVRWHGFLRRLDRKYPLVAELDCSFDPNVWNRALEEQAS